MKKYFLILIWAVIWEITLAQNINLVKFDEITFDSKIMGGLQTLYVHLPFSYTKDKNKRYPVVYVLDPEERFSHTLVAQELLSSYNNSIIPECILVGIKSKDRYLDFSPAAIENWQVPDFIKKAGGADIFRKYISSELIPFLDKKYKTVPFRVLVGHSLGGLFALETLINENHLFKAYIALDPSTFWNNGDIVNQFKSKLGQIPSSSSCRLFMADGLVPLSMEVKLEPNHERFEQFLKNTHLNNLHFELIGLRGESHNEMPYQGTYLGLKSVFYDYRVAMPWALTESQISDYYKGLSVQYGYPVAIPEMLKNKGGGRNE